MSYRINKRTRSNGTVYWRLIRETWENAKRIDVHIPTDQLLQHGLSPDMSIEDAKERVSQLNALAKINKQDDNAKASALRDKQRRERVQSAHLPARFCAEFENDYLRAEMDIGPSGPAKYKKALSQWLYCRALIAELNLPQAQWWQHRRRIYDYLSKRETSLNYGSKIIRILNMWGTFIAQKTGGSFIPVPAPKGYDREMIADAYQESGKTKKASAPLSPEVLEAARGKLSSEQYNWLYVSVWFGLRPAEIDSLKKKARVDRRDLSGVPVLWVYQSKLTSLPKEQRYKPIPCIYPEQLKALELVEQGALDRPLVQTLRKHVGKDITCYGGRKGFTDLMLSRGQGLEDIATWLGHTNIDRTWRSYKNRGRVSFRKAS